ncbi:hypothetical protein D7V97_30945 [Corallococcus sp. CA053C]|uniref:AHH domain-containing protein n=1 Tax=Corallococcus sp. CA053C TaxID=2316732 RepID=UPI000EA0858C|nr:AHH domain-containing protein [Corallococcus sp. CA053C]RKG99962.1 hypothetical protein D7V97_30945 [Corallococcus sp. CA053C]
MEMGETVSDVQKLQDDGQCVICSKKHDDPKKEKVESPVSKSGWERDKSMVGVFDGGDAERAAIYPNAHFPPPYPTEGHHALAFTSFVQKGKDRRLRLNHFLDKVGFAPNQPQNIIQLPNRHGAVSPKADPTASWPADVKKEYKSFWVSIDLGKPLQLHTGRHAKSYFKTSDLIYHRMAFLAYDATTCTEESMQEFENNLKGLVKGAVNFAFLHVVGGSWICHPEHLRVATDLYGKTGKHVYTYLHGGGKKQKVEHEGYPGAGARPPPWTTVKLDTTPF